MELNNKPQTLCYLCRHCSQYTYFPVCLRAERQPQYEGVYGSRINARYPLCADARPENGECHSWTPIPEPQGKLDRLARAFGLHPWLWRRTSGNYQQ
jgi:hypothetical protein